MKGRKGMLTVLGAFAAPVILAAIVYQMGWFNAGVSNKGEFMDIELTLEWLRPENPADSEWIVFYPLADTCDERCTNVLYSMNQGYQALHKRQDKVHPLIVRSDKSNMTIDQLKQQYSNIKVMAQQPAHLPTLLQLSSDYLYLVDPFGKVVLRYKATDKRQEMIMITRDWMADLKRVLKYSRTK